jgi:hypothetical protein
MKTIREELEPAAAVQNTNNVIDLCVQASIAISLKRIADNLEHVTHHGAVLTHNRGN